MVENTARSSNKTQNPVEQHDNNAGSTSEVAKSFSKLIEDSRAASLNNSADSLFEQVLKNDSAGGKVDLRGVFNVAESQLDNNSPVKKYLNSDREGRNEIVKSIVADCMSTDEKRQARGAEQFQQIRYFEALANLSSTQGKSDQQSNLNRSHALHVLAGQELSSDARAKIASDLLFNLATNGDSKMQGEIASARNDKQKERDALANVAIKKIEQIEKGDLSAALKLLELHFQQSREGNQTLSDVAQKIGKVLEAAKEFQTAIEKPVTLEDAKPTAPRQGRTPEGTLILPGDRADEYKQYAVKAGNVINDQGKEVGKLQDDGTVLLSGMSPFKLSANAGSAFHGKGSDGERLDLVAAADQKKFHGFIASADGKEVFTVTGGNMYDAKGKMLGKFGENGQIAKSEDGMFSSESLSKFSAGAKVIGEENGKSRSFVASASTTDGFMQIKDEKTGAYVRHEVRMGMLIDSRTGEQSGWIVPPVESADGKLSGGLIVTGEKGNLKAVPFTDKQDMVFSLQLTGASGVEAAPMQGVTTGKNEVFNIGEAKRLQKESKDHFTEMKNEVASQKSIFSIATAFGVHDAQEANAARNAAAHQKNINELDKLLDADRSAIAYVDSFKQTLEAAKDAMKGKPEGGKAADAPPVIEIPSLDSAELTATVNGKLAIGKEIFTVKNGDLYAAGKENEPPTGKLLPGYIAQFNNGERLVDLSREIRVAMSFTSAANSEKAELLGMGPGHMTKGLGYQQGGLIDAHSLTANARRFEEQARKGNEEYFANRPYVTGSIGNWMLGDREALLNDYAKQIGGKVNNVDSLVKNLMRDAFDPEKAGNRQFDVASKELATLMYMTGAQAANTQKMALTGQQVQGQISDSAAMAAMTVATAGISAGFAAAAKGGQLAAVGVTSSYAATGLELGAGMAAGAGSRVIFNASDRSDWRSNAAGGAVEGLTLIAQNKLLSKIAEAKAAANALKQTREVTQQTLLKTTITKARELAPVAAQELAISTMTTAGFMSGQLVRNGENPIANMDVQTLAIASVTNLLGRYASARAGDFMNSKLVRGAVGEAGKTSTANAIVRSASDSFVNAASARSISSMQEQRRAPYGEVSLAKTAADVLEAGALGGATGLALSGILRAGDYGTKALASRYSTVKNDLLGGSSQVQSNERTTEVSRERLQSITADASKTPAAPRKLEDLWKGLRNAVEKENAPRVADVPPNPPRIAEPETTPQQRKEYELDFQRRVEAGEYSKPPVQKDNNPITDPVEISKKIIENHIRDLNRVDASSDNRPIQLIKADVYVDDTIGPRQLDTISTPASFAFDKALALVAKSGVGAAEDIANQATSVIPKLIGHTREVTAQVTLAKETTGEIDPKNTFVKTANDRVEATIAHIRNASKDLPETDYFSAMQDIAGRRGMNRWMEQNTQRKEIQHEVANDLKQRQMDVAEDPSKIHALRRNPEEIASATVAAKACQNMLETEIARRGQTGQSSEQQQQALKKLTAFQKNLEQARKDASHNPTFKAYFAEMDAYMQKVFAQPES